MASRCMAEFPSGFFDYVVEFFVLHCFFIRQCKYCNISIISKRNNRNFSCFYQSLVTGKIRGILYVDSVNECKLQSFCCTTLLRQDRRRLGKGKQKPAVSFFLCTRLALSLHPLCKKKETTYILPLCSTSSP